MKFREHLLKSTTQPLGRKEEEEVLRWLEGGYKSRQENSPWRLRGHHLITRHSRLDVHVFPMSLTTNTGETDELSQWCHMSSPSFPYPYVPIDGTHVWRHMSQHFDNRETGPGQCEWDNL